MVSGLSLCLGLSLRLGLLPRLSFGLFGGRLLGLLFGLLCAFRLLYGCIFDLLAGGFFGFSASLGFFDGPANHLIFILVFLFAFLARANLGDSLAYTISTFALLLHLAHGFLVHLNVLVHHHLLEENEVLDGQYLLQKTLMDALGCLLLRHDKISLAYAQILDIRLKFALYKSFEI